MQYVQVGKIIKPKGLQGELKCHFFGIDTIDKAEMFRGVPLYVNRADLKLGADEILATDLVGFVVVDESGKKLGVIKSVDDYGGGDVIDCGTFSFPYEDDFVIETNMTERKLVCKSIS
ncbi:MAG: hypothetical protein LBG88_01220 [Christensenellaceae bacterium]|jgi:ribosomal 30S subunit maturation factor RimM|nr:hypothetical protein [Christensenellaceae bacterium]